MHDGLRVRSPTTVRLIWKSQRWMLLEVDSGMHSMPYVLCIPVTTQIVRSPWRTCFVRSPENGTCLGA